MERCTRQSLQQHNPPRSLTLLPLVLALTAIFLLTTGQPAFSQPEQEAIINADEPAIPGDEDFSHTFTLPFPGPYQLCPGGVDHGTMIEFNPQNDLDLTNPPQVTLQGTLHASFGYPDYVYVKVCQIEPGTSQLLKLWVRPSNAQDPLIRESIKIQCGTGGVQVLFPIDKTSPEILKVDNPNGLIFVAGPEIKQKQTDPHLGFSLDCDEGTLGTLTFYIDPPGSFYVVTFSVGIPVGGIAVPPNKLALLAPWIAVLMLIVVGAASVMIWKRRQGAIRS